MALTPRTVKTYALDGTTKDFNITFEYLARKFVVVTLIGTDRRELILNDEYRFTSNTSISTTVAWGPGDGYEMIEIRRVTSATDRLVDFIDGSMLKASTLNIANIQSLHIAEEARDLTADTIAVNNDGNLDARGRRIVNGADGIDPGDFVTVRQQDSWAASAKNEADRAKSEADRATLRANESSSSASSSASSATTATNKAEELQALYGNVIRVEGASLPGLTGPRAGRAFGFDESGNPIAYVLDSGSNSALSIAISKANGGELIGYKPGSVPDADAALRNIRVKLDESRSLADFVGFVGDGVNDDTAAVERAIKWQISKAQVFNHMVGGGGASAAIVCPGLTVPTGARVKITRNIPYVPIHIVADGFASFEIAVGVVGFTTVTSYRSYWRDLFFIGGTTHVNQSNMNVNAGMWVYERCTFIGASDTAVYQLTESNGWPVNSTQSIFKDCQWYRNKKNLYTKADHAFIIGGWMQNDPDYFVGNSAAVLATGLLTVAQMMLIPGDGFPDKSRWFDIYGAGRFLQVRFGGEGGGLPAVYYFGIPPRFTSGTANSAEAGVTFDGCTGYFGNGSRSDRGQLVIANGQLPPVMRVTNQTGPITGRIIHNDPANGGIADIAAYIADRKAAWSGDDMFREFSYVFTGCKFKVGVDLLWPTALDPYVYTDIGRNLKVAAYAEVTAGQSAATTVLQRVGFSVNPVDPYKILGTSSGVSTPSVPPRAYMAHLRFNLALNSTVKNNLRYFARIYMNGVPTKFYRVYDHVNDGQPHFDGAMSFPCTPGQVIDLRISQSSGATVTIADGDLYVEFDCKQFQ